MKSIATASLTLATLVNGHGRWKCPLPRDEKTADGTHIAFDNTGNKYAACGPQSGKWGFGSVTALTPGWTTLSWEESVSHTGSPFRIAILDASEVAKVVLLDHIPHNEVPVPKPVANMESTYYTYRMSVNIPDIKCDKCSLQLLYVMTDKSVKCGIETCYYNPADAACKGSTNPAAATCAGAPNSQVCVAEGECFSNYHSCTDVTINGKFPLENFAMDSQPADWPYKSMKMQYYGLEVGTWSSNGWLAGVPTNYTTDFRNLQC